MPFDSMRERQWAAQWRAAADALAQVRAHELATLSPSDALEAADALLAIGAGTPLSDDRLAWSGLIELQRVLRRSR